MTDADLERRLERIEALLVMLVDSNPQPTPATADPKYFARRILEVGARQAKKEMKEGAYGD